MGNRDANQRGFSLIELAIVIIISGILLSLAVSAYNQYLEKQRIYSTQAKIDTLSEAMSRFFMTYSHYPCPASFSAQPGDDNFGQITDCYDDLAVASGSCGDENGDGADDYCVDSITRDHDNDGGAVTPDITIRMRKGSIPFVALKEGIGWDADETNFAGPDPFGVATGSRVKKYPGQQDIGIEDTLDSYKNRFTYVLTEIQGTEGYFPKLGGIEIRDEHYNPPANEAVTTDSDYIFLSHGADGMGAYTLSGNAVGGGCPAVVPVNGVNEHENCDDDYVYVASLRYDANIPDRYDDMIFYRNYMNYYLWDTSDSNKTNVHNINTGNVGVGATDPKAKLHIMDGNILADVAALWQDPPVTGPVIKPAGTIMADKYCGYDANGGIDCFEPEKIGGTGMDCVNDDITNLPDTTNPRLQVMQGFERGKLHCRELYTTNHNPGCTGGAFAQGVRYNFVTRRLAVTSCRPPPP